MQVALPGFVDLQVNGFAGVDFNAPDLRAADLQQAVAALVSSGVTRFLPTLITGPAERFRSAARALLGLGAPAIAGIHMEGPYLSPLDGPRGAHPRQFIIPPSRDDFDRRQEAAAGRIVLVTLAPEVPGALDLIEYLVLSGVRVALGHTDAAPATIADAVRAGATLSTHLGNGCAAVLPRHPNVIWEQLADDRLWASLIVDLHHLPASTIKVFARAKPANRIILVTDATAAAAAAPGVYRLADTEIEVAADRRVALHGTALLAGSALTMSQAIGNMVRATGLPLADVVAMASETPAAYLGIAPSGTVGAEWHADACRLEILDVRPTEG